VIVIVVLTGGVTGVPSTFLGNAHAAEAPQQGLAITFPGDRPAVRSPSGRYKLRLRRVAAPSDAPTYCLRLIDSRTKTGNDVITFERSVKVTWRPQSEGFFLNAYAVSNASDCLVVLPDGTRQPQSLAERIAAQGDLGIKESVGDSHYYVICTGWDGPNRVAVTLSGHHDDDAQGFSYRLTYDVKSGRLTHTK
jgi:hypothetical protein